MGQQQLLLLVLGIVIVGIAVVAGIQAFGEGKNKAAQDAAVSDAMRIISDVQAWKLKPGAFGGGAEKAADDFTTMNFKALGYPVVDAGAPYATINGCYEFTAFQPATLVVYSSGETTTDDNGTPLDASDDVQSTTCTPGSEIATVKVSGTSTDLISWTYQ